MSFHDRPNADPKFLAEMARQQAERRAEALKEVKGRPPAEEPDDGSGRVVTHPPPKNEQEARFYELYDAGLNDREIGAGMGKSKPWAGWFRNLLGLAPNRKHGDSVKERTGRPSKGGRKFDPAKLATVAKCANEGMTDEAIAERLNISASSVSEMRKRAGIAPLEDYRSVLGRSA